MYHPSSENPREEYIELWNRGPTNVNLTGWHLSGGVDFGFPSNTVLAANAYLAVAGQKAAFQAKYPGVPNVVGDFVTTRLTTVIEYNLTNYLNVLSNTRNTINLRDASDQLVDSVSYADEGDWAVRQRGFNHFDRRGWIWSKDHDGLGKSLELINPTLPNEHGQNWTASVTAQGTPGRVNSVFATNIAPLILEARHQPPAPRSTDPITFTCRVLDESAANVTVRLQWRVDSATPPPFTISAMFDDGMHADALAGDGLFGLTIPAQPNNTVVEFFFSASDGQGRERTWPGPAIASPDDGSGPTGQAANALLQVDDEPRNAFGGVPSGQPVYKLILTENERVELAGIPCSPSQLSDAQMNATWISLDAQGTEVRYLVGVRNRGHASRCANPPNYRVNFVSDRPWKGDLALNINTVQVHLQVFGSTLAIKSGAAGTYSRPVQVRVNNENHAQSGSPMFGSYAANEAYNGDWAERHFPMDSEGNIYKAIRDIDPPDFEYRGEVPADYQNTYFKETNVSEDDWTDLISLSAVMGVQFSNLGQPNPVPFTPQNAQTVINVEQWLTHLAVMSLVCNSESGLNSGHNDDYYMYRGALDPRFILLFHDLDQLCGLGGQAFPPDDTIWGATFIQGVSPGSRSTGDFGGSGAAMGQFMTNAVFAPVYYATLQRLLDTTFSAAQFDSLADQTLGGWVTPNTINTIKNFMNQRRAYVQAVISGFVPPVAITPMATITGGPRSPTFRTSATLTVGGTGITHYRWRLNAGPYSAETPVGTPIQLSGLANGSSNIVSVVGRNSAGLYQSFFTPTLSAPWVVDTSWPAVRLNEVLARNDSAVNHQGTFPDLIELHNEGSTTVDLSGLRLTDDPADPNKFTFPNPTSLAAGSNLVVYANDPDGTTGFHLGFGLAQTGDGVYLFQRAASGGALLDSVQFGPQLPDLSIGRLGSAGAWILTPPTFGAVNIAQPRGEERNVKINEWLAAGQSPFPDDFVELLNLDALPVDLSGLYLTDAPVGAPTRHRLPNLTFIGAGGFLTFIADGNDNQPDHLGFALDSDLGEIALRAANLALIDCVIYGPQLPGFSMGRCPDGAAPIKTLVLPTPSGGNACPVAPPTAEGITLMASTNLWKYMDSGADLGVTWRAPGFNDSAWPSGPGLLGRMRNGGALPEPIQTQLTLSNTRTSFYFRTHFNLPANHGLSTIQLTHIIDDGAVFYLNGNELFRYNLPGGEIRSTTLALQNILDSDYQEPVTLPLNTFQTGDNVFAVEVHQNLPTSQDIVFGLVLTGIAVTNNPAGAGVVLNEVFANNATQAEPDGATPDWVELYNPSTNAVDLVGMSLADGTGRRWFFPPASVLTGLGRFRVKCDADRPASATNTGFGLKASGDVLTLYNRAPNTNTAIDTRAFGLQTADFSIGRVPDGGPTWTLTLPTIGSANIGGTLGDVMQLKINEWLADPLPGEDDWFELYNPNPQPVDIGSCFLSDDQTSYRLPALSFLGAITNAWQKFVADNNTAAGADHVPFRLGASADNIGLANASGVPINSVSFVNQQEDVSEGRLPDSASAIVRFAGTKSPGEPNFAPLTNIVINEVLSHTDLPLEDAIELHNPTASAVDISGWWLSDSRNSPRRYQIPANTILPGRGFRVFYENQFNNGDAAAIPFALSSASGDEVYLSAASPGGVMNGLRTFVDFGAAENAVSFGRHRTSVGFEFTAMSQRTFGVDNPATVEQFRTGTGLSNAYPKVGPVVISEIMYHPPDILSPGVTNDNIVEEFIELHNTGASPALLYDALHPTNGWRLRDAVDFQFSSAHSIPSGGYLLVVSFHPGTNLAALAQFRSRYGSNSVLVGPYSGKLDNSGESVELLKPDPPQTNGAVPCILVEKVVYSDRAPWPVGADGLGQSLQRVSQAAYANDPVNWVAAAPSPGPSSMSDTDGDGMPDDWEMQYNFDKNNPADAAQDADGDGLTNLQEYTSGTHPRDPASYLKVESVSPSGPNKAVRFIAVAGKTYTVQYRNSLGTGSWLKLQDVPAQATTQEVVVLDQSSGGVPNRFYRLLTPAAL